MQSSAPEPAITGLIGTCGFLFFALLQRILHDQPSTIQKVKSAIPVLHVTSYQKLFATCSYLRELTNKPPTSSPVRTKLDKWRPIGQCEMVQPYKDSSDGAPFVEFGTDGARRRSFVCQLPKVAASG